MRPHNRVMFVDDEEGVRLSWNRVLSDQGFQVTTAQSGKAAIGELQLQPVDVVVSDLRMPDVDGFELLEWIQHEQPNTRFIMLTGYGSKAVERRARQLGAFEYLDKPIDPLTLTSIVSAAADVEEEVEEEVEVEAPEPVLVAEPVVEEAQEAEAEAEEVEVARPSRLLRALKIVGGLIAAPIMGLAFVIFLPVIGFLAFFWYVAQAVRNVFRPTATET